MQFQFIICSLQKKDKRNESIVGFPSLSHYVRGLLCHGQYLLFQGGCFQESVQFFKSIRNMLQNSLLLLPIFNFFSSPIHMSNLTYVQASHLRALPYIIIYNFNVQCNSCAKKKIIKRKVNYLLCQGFYYEIELVVEFRFKVIPKIIVYSPKGKIRRLPLYNICIKQSFVIHSIKP